MREETRYGNDQGWSGYPNLGSGLVKVWLMAEEETFDQGDARVEFLL